jgi:hypothetical protein
VSPFFFRPAATGALDRYRDRYVLLQHDLDEPAVATWRRLASAVAQVEAAAAASVAVDAIEARVILRDQQWSIARALAAHARLRQGPRSPAQIRALAKAVASTRRRVDAVAAYARQLPCSPSKPVARSRCPSLPRGTTSSATCWPRRRLTSWP